MRKDWTNQDIARLDYLIEHNGKANGIKLFAKETLRTEDSVRSKLARISKERIVLDAENTAYDVDDCPTEKLSWF